MNKASKPLYYDETSEFSPQQIKVLDGLVRGDKMSVIKFGRGKIQPNWFYLSIQAELKKSKPTNSERKV